MVEERESWGEICLGLCAVYGGKEDVDVWGDRCLSDLAMGFAATCVVVVVVDDILRFNYCCSLACESLTLILGDILRFFPKVK